jgi:hypothetical protein
MRALQLAGMSERTQQCYTRSVRMLVDLYGKTPDLINELQLQDYFLHGVLGSGHSNLLKNKLKTPENTSICGLIDQFSCKNSPIKDGGY